MRIDVLPLGLIWLIFIMSVCCAADDTEEIERQPIKHADGFKQLHWSVQIRPPPAFSHGI